MYRATRPFQLSRNRSSRRIRSSGVTTSIPHRVAFSLDLATWLDRLGPANGPRAARSLPVVDTLPETVPASERQAA